MRLGKYKITKMCMMCGVELGELEERGDKAVCESCEGYYFPEPHVYFRGDDELGPEVIIRCIRKKPRRLARVKTPELWVPKTGHLPLP